MSSCVAVSFSLCYTLRGEAVLCLSVLQLLTAGNSQQKTHNVVSFCGPETQTSGTESPDFCTNVTAVFNDQRPF